MKLGITIIFAFTFFSVQNLDTRESFESNTSLFIEQFLIDFNLIDSKNKPISWLNSSSFWSKRVSIKSKELFLNKYNQKDYKDYTFSFFYYENAESCDLARKSYLEHYSSDGRPINRDSKGVKRSPVLNIFNKNTIVVMELSCEEYEMQDKWKWNMVKSDILKRFANEESEMLENACGRILKWSNNKN